MISQESLITKRIYTNVIDWKATKRHILWCKVSLPREIPLQYEVPHIQVVALQSCWPNQPLCTTELTASSDAGVSPNCAVTNTWVRSSKCLCIWTDGLASFLHNSRLNKGIEEKKIFKKFRDLTRNWTQIACLVVSPSNHYTGMFSVLLCGCNWIRSMHGWLC